MAQFGKTAEAVIKVVANTKQANQGLNRTIKVMAGLTAGIFAAKKAMDILSNASDAYAKRAQLVAATGSASFKQVQIAAKGLITETQALEVSAALMNGAFKLTQEQMNTAAKAMVALRNQGNDFNQVIDNVTRALVEGNGRALRQFGVNVEGSTGKLSTFNNVMAALNELADSQSAKMDVAGDSMLRASVKYQDAVEKFNLALGKLAAKLGPLLNDLVDFANLITSDTLSRADVGRSRFIADIEARINERDSNDPLGLVGDLGAVTGRARALGRGLQVGIGRDIDPHLAFGRGSGANIRLQSSTERSAIGSAVFDGIRSGITIATPLLARAVEKGAESGVVKGGGGRRELTVGPATIGERLRNGISAAPRGSVASLSILPAGITGGSELGLDAIAGGLRGAAFIEQRDARLGGLSGGADELGRIQEAMAAMEPVAAQFAAAGASAFNAWIQGSVSAGEAIRKFIGGALTSIATQMAGEAIKHGAMAIGSLAIGNLKGAGLHGKAAAMHAAGALAVGGMAKALGGSGGAGGRASGALPGAAAGAGAGGGGGGRSTTVIVAPSPFEHNPRESTRRVRRALGITDSHHAGTGTVTQ